MSKLKLLMPNINDLILLVIIVVTSFMFSLLYLLLQASVFEYQLGTLVQGQMQRPNVFAMTIETLLYGSVLSFSTLLPIGFLLLAFFLIKITVPIKNAFIRYSLLIIACGFVYYKMMRFFF